MSDIGDNSDLFTISTVPDEAVGENDAASQGQSVALDNAETSKASKAGSAPKAKNKNKRTRKSSKAGKATTTEQEAEDINLHVESGWSDDEKYDKDHPSKRIAANGENGSPVAVKKASSHLESFTVRAVVTRKDVDVIFEAEAGKKEEIEQQTATSITIVAGKDDPEIVVDRVLSIKGHIDDVATTYKIIAEGMLKIKQSAAAAAKDTKNTMESDAVAGSEQDNQMDGGNTVPASISKESEHNDHQDDNDEPVVDGEDAPNAEEPVATEDSSTNAAETALDVEGSDDKKSKEAARKEAAARRVTLRMLVPHKCVGSIMGHGGKTINNIREVTSVNIHTSESTLPLSSERIVEIVGAPESIEKALRLIAEALTKDIAAYTSADYYVPAANLPSAMTVETQSRKRKDNKRHGPHNDSRAGNKGHHQGNRGSGFRSNNSGGYGGNRQHSNTTASHRNVSSHNNGNGYNNRSVGAVPQGGGRNDRYGRQNDRQGVRGRGPSSMSHSNRIPVGSSSGGPQGQQGQYNNGGSYRAGNQQSGPRQPILHGHGGTAMGYNSGYVMPAASTYTGYAGQGTAVSGGGTPGTRYGNVASTVRPTHAVGTYGTGYGVSSPAYQFPAPVSYAYAPAPMQGIYNNQPAQAVNNSYPSRSYASHGGRPQQMPQPSMGIGSSGAGPGMGGSVGETAGQAIQQMYVSSDKIGAVIGRRGETINEIRRSTNARVEIQDSAQGAKKRLVLITGAYEQVRSAYHMINEKLEAARQPTRP
ncbi:PAB1 binding protein [Coemansia sp. RSA 1813]|nr:PAB1 binding protein [Coemansia sp. RSA 1646]KAJ1766117.1 PAB1 binding protein [Coemansia sp. RSA 1843]KAJ2093026.1 PAB1 binding protein [Coemansia sp. RSA 986]KAJ2214066.1 PAB1 binding protein [Coemansia sp. RSA 487]KAJ2569134.1 PAB1 binding protein [Coemansia sp. RSA 1813]